MVIKVVRVDGNFVSKHWSALVVALRESVPEAFLDGDVGINNILANILSGRMHCWMCVEDSDVVRLVAMLVTTTIHDLTSGARNLLLYSAYRFTSGPTDIEIYKAAYTTLTNWARSQRLSNIVAYTRNDRMVEFVTRNIPNTDKQYLVTVQVPEEEIKWVDQVEVEASAAQ